MRYLFLILLFLFSSSAFSQVNLDQNDNFIDLGVGVGPNYGIFGAKGIFGKNGTGLLLGAGTFDGFLTTSFGGQITIEFLYISVIYGTYGSYYIDYFGRQEKGLLKGVIGSVGGRINLLKSKLMYLEIGAGIYSGKGAPIPNGTQERESGFTLNAGLNFRLGRFK